MYKRQTVAGKTGTNQKAKGVFFAGMTGYYVSTLWAVSYTHLDVYKRQVVCGQNTTAMPSSMPLLLTAVDTASVIL